MRKFIALIIILISFTFVDAQVSQYFNPFRFGIKTVKGLRVLTDEGFKNVVREKAAELLNNYFNTSTFQVSGGTIVNTSGVNVNNSVRESYGNWRNLMREAAESVLQDETSLNRAGPPYIQYLGWQVLNVEFDNQGRLAKIYIAPAEYLSGFPIIPACRQGIGQCILFVFDVALRILYTGALALGVIFLMIAGILYITKPAKVEEVHKRVQWGIIGIVVAVLSFTVVIALERWLVSGLAIPGVEQPISEESELTPEEMAGGVQPGQTEFPGGTGGSQLGEVQQGMIIIHQDTATIRKDGTFVILVEARNKKCSLTWEVLDITQGFEISTDPSASLGQEIQPQNLQFLEIKFLDDMQRIRGGDKIKILFRSKPTIEDQVGSACSLNISQLDLTYPIEKVVVERAYPTTTINLKEIRGQQYLRVEIPENLKDALEQALGFTVAQRNIYNPPFYLYLEYTVVPPDQDGSCTLLGTLRGTSVSSFSFDKTKAASLYVFNRDFSINISYQKGKSKYYVSRYIPLPANTIGFVYLKIYDYEGRCKVDENSFKKLSEGQVFDIETGKIYLLGDLGDILKQLLFGL